MLFYNYLQNQKAAIQISTTTTAVIDNGIVRLSSDDSSFKSILIDIGADLGPEKQICITHMCLCMCQDVFAMEMTRTSRRN